MDLKAEIWILKYIAKYPKYTLLTIIGSLVDIVLFTLPAYFVAELIRLLTEGNFSFGISLIGLYLLVGFIQSLFFGIAAYFNEVLAHRITTDMTLELYVNLQSRSLSYLDKFDIGQIMASATNDTRQVNIGLSPAIRVIVQAFIQVIVISLLLNYYESRFLTFFGVYFIGFLLLNFWYARKVFPVQDLLLEDFENISVIANETFNGVQELKSYISENHFIGLFRNASQHHAQTLYKKGKIQAFYYPTLWFWMMMAVIASFGIFWMMDGSLTLSSFSGSFSAMLFFKFLSEAFNWAFTETISAAAASRRLYKINFEDREMKEDRTDNVIKFDEKNMDIEFKNVSFRYNNSDVKWILKNLSFTIAKNETVVLIGPPGSGKSSINKLLLRLYEPNTGQILLNGKNIFDYDDSYQKNVSAIEQNPFLFSDTIEFNVTFGNPLASTEEVTRALEIAQAQFVYSLPEKLQSQIGDRGVKLSGGEKQRLAIARALLLNPRILIMDDASSALDAQTEMKIQESISSVLKERTSIITTHRLSVISKADKILLLEHGEIVAQGTHRQLIVTSPEYRKLFEKQYDLPPIQSSM